ncbi:hypothetical protein CBF45_07425 [Bordetella sp. J329]|nr:hypothetical protein CBF45_07425 [Bordetella sp. J329]
MCALTMIMQKCIIWRMNTASEIIKTLRSSGMSQSEIARKSGIPQSRISRWEAGMVPTGADDALRLAQILKTVSRRSKKDPAHV